MNEGGEMMVIIIPTSQAAAILVEPCEGTLDLPASAIAAKLSAILSGTSLAPASMRRNHFNSTLCQLLIERITVVGTIPDKSSGSSQRESFIEHSFDKADFMWARKSRVHDDRKTMIIAIQPIGLHDVPEKITIDKSGAKLIAGIETMHMIKKGQLGCPKRKSCLLLNNSIAKLSNPCAVFSNGFLHVMSLVEILS